MCFTSRKEAVIRPGALRITLPGHQKINMGFNSNKTPTKWDLLKQVDDLHANPMELSKMLCEIVKYESPSRHWSVSNQLLLLMNGTRHALSVKEWEEIGHRVKKGSVALYILARMDDKETSAGGESKGPVEFKAVPKFRVEDTIKWNGQDWVTPPTDYPRVALPSLSLKCEEWGIQLCYSVMEPGHPGAYSMFGGKKTIRLATEQPITVFQHEMVHAAHDRIKGAAFKDLPSWRKTAVAELATAVLGHLYEVEVQTPSKASWNYLAAFANENERPAKLCRAVLKDSYAALMELLKPLCNGAAKES